MGLLTVIAILVAISAIFSYFNERVIKLPGTIGVVTISVIVSLLILIAGKTHILLSSTILSVAQHIDFSSVLLNVMLGFLLFASALHFDYRKLKEQRLPVLVLSTVGVLVSASVFGALLYLATHILPFDLPFSYCLLFGALISPTDPIAVGAVLKTSRVPPRLHTIISGESLFNDGLGLVLFVVMLNFTDPTTRNMTFVEIAAFFAREVIGGIALGIITGFFGYRMMRAIKDYQTIFLISAALVLGISVLANALHTSIPLAAVSAGLMVGYERLNTNRDGKEFLDRTWELLDEVLNTVLFVMIGLQLVLMPYLNKYVGLGFLCVLIILIARMLSISFPAIFILRRLNRGNLSILTWAGVRGGISVAMALSLPDSPYRELIISCCYFMVIFSIIVQGLTLNRVVNWAVASNISKRKKVSAEVNTSKRQA